MTTITRQQLRDAIEAGITAAESVEGFTTQAADRLRVVGAQATVVARGNFTVRAGESRWVPCPMAAAFPDWEKRRFRWDLAFATAYDRATRDAVNPNPRIEATANILQVTDDNSTEGEGA